MIFEINSPKYGTKEILIDDEDWDIVKKYKWHVSKDTKSNSFYCMSYVSPTKRISLHRLIMGFPGEKQVDHISGDTLDNKKLNLRICTGQENKHNKRKLKPTTLKYKGVSIRKNVKTGGKRFRAFICLDYKQINLGSFKNVNCAACAYNNAAVKLFGEFAKLNVI